MSWKSSSRGDYAFLNDRTYVRSNTQFGSTFLGIVSYVSNDLRTVDAILTIAEDSGFYYTGNTITYTGITQNKVYVKNDTLSVEDYVGMTANKQAGYSNDVGKYYACPDDNGNGVYIYKVLQTLILKSDCSSYKKFLSLAMHDSAISKMYEQAPYFQYGKIYERTVEATSYTFISYDEIIKTAELFAIMYGYDDGSKKVVPTNNIWWANQYYVLTRIENTGISCIQSTTPLTELPETPVDTGIYYFSANVVSSGSNAGVYQYSATTAAYTQIANTTTSFYTYFKSSHPATLFEIVDETQLVEEKKLSDVLDGPYELSTSIKMEVLAESTLVNATTNTDKKFYLEINGVEVL